MTHEPRLGRETRVQLLLRMQPPWVFIDEIRRFVESFCACTGATAQRETDVALAVHELMQNAAARPNGEPVELLLDVDAEQDRVRVAVTNRCTDEEWDELRTRVEKMNAEPDPFKHYIEHMRTVPAASRGGLGLARIRCEAQLDISVRREGKRATVVAEGKLEASPLVPFGGGQ